MEREKGTNSKDRGAQLIEFPPFAFTAYRSLARHVADVSGALPEDSREIRQMRSRIGRGRKVTFVSLLGDRVAERDSQAELSKDRLQDRPCALRAFRQCCVAREQNESRNRGKVGISSRLVWEMFEEKLWNLKS